MGLKEDWEQRHLDSDRQALKHLSDIKSYRLFYSVYSTVYPDALDLCQPWSWPCELIVLYNKPTIRIWESIRLPPVKNWLVYAQKYVHLLLVQRLCVYVVALENPSEVLAVCQFVIYFLFSALTERFYSGCKHVETHSESLTDVHP